MDRRKLILKRKWVKESLTNIGVLHTLSVRSLLQGWFEVILKSFWKVFLYIIYISDPDGAPNLAEAKRLAAIESKESSEGFSKKKI